MKVVIVIPTYNEADNIGRLIEALSDVFAKLPDYDCEVLVVEGNSPDGTAGIVREKSKGYPFVNLLMEKEKAGLGAAYIYGFEHAINEMDADAVVEMDADFQHDPYALPKLLAPLKEGYDYVIGSRYIEGGSIPKEWSLYRKFLSVVGNFVARLILGVFSVKDFTTGYKASRVKGFLDQIDLKSVKSKGFSYKIDLLYRMHKKGAKIKEVPIDFGLRDRGESKMESNNTLDSLRVVLSIRIDENKNFIKFCIVGFAGFITDMGLANIFRIFPIPANVSASLSAIIAMLVTFYLNNTWSFSENKITSRLGILKKLPMYMAFSAVPIGFRFWFVGLIVRNYGNGVLYYNGAILVSIILGLIWNYIIYSKIIWRNKNI